MAYSVAASGLLFRSSETIEKKELLEQRLNQAAFEGDSTAIEIMGLIVWQLRNNNMVKYVQGKAPAVLFEGDQVVWAFREGKLELKDEFAFCNENKLHNRLLAAGAVCLDDNKDTYFRSTS